MLFDPSTSFKSVRGNLKFWGRSPATGHPRPGSAACFPMTARRSRSNWRTKGRLKGDICDPDYDFLDPKVSEYFQALNRAAAADRLDPRQSRAPPQLKFAWNEVGIMDRLFPPLPDMAEYQDTLRDITAKSNEMLFKVVEDMADTVISGRPHRWTTEILRSECMRFLDEFHRERNAFVLRNQPALLRVLREDAPQVRAPRAAGTPDDGGGLGGGLAGILAPTRCGPPRRPRATPIASPRSSSWRRRGPAPRSSRR